MQGFVDHYNERHRHRGIRMVTPGQRQRGEDAEVLRRRRGDDAGGLQTPSGALDHRESAELYADQRGVA